jgi:hypothetical protein
LLVVTDKSGNRLNTSNGMTPFGFAFNNAGTLVVSEAFGGAANQSAASSYEAAEDGTLNVISGSVPNSQTASMLKKRTRA